MRTLFRVLRWFFYFFTVVIGIVYLERDVFFDERGFEITKTFIIPWYLVFCGLMLWYLIATFRVGNEKYKEDVDKERIATRSFLIGSVFWIVFALAYILVVA